VADLPILPERPYEEPPFRRAAILFHPKVDVAKELADQIARVLALNDIASVACSVWDAQEVHELLLGADVCITLGGDGSILRAARLAAPLGLPVLGVNLGKLGFLAEVEPSDLQERLPSILAGNYWLEKRMMLNAILWRDGRAIGAFDCLNEVVVARRNRSRVVHIDTSIDGHELTTYTADGVLVATPTGSTGYALAVGGPIMHPEVRNLVLAPISAHLSLRSPLVLPETTEVRLTVHTDHEAGASFDGQSDIELFSGDSVVVRAGPYSARFVRGQERTYFYHTLIHKLGIRH
jgi:NAD+ kinase